MVNVEYTKVKGMSKYMYICIYTHILHESAQRSAGTLMYASLETALNAIISLLICIVYLGRSMKFKK